MVGNIQTFGYSVKCGFVGERRRNSFMILLIYIAAFILSGIAIGYTQNAYLTIILALLLFSLIWFTRRYFTLIYDFEFEKGELRVAAIYGNIRRRKILTVNVRDFTVIESYSHGDEKKIASYGVVKHYYAVDLTNPDDCFFAIFTDESGNICAFYFNSHPRLMAALKFYNPSALAM